MLGKFPPHYWLYSNNLPKVRHLKGVFAKKGEKTVIELNSVSITNFTFFCCVFNVLYPRAEDPYISKYRI